ncbi:MAG: glycosyltransferase [Desulfobacteraceae bacterium]|nr:glycosyltransferase [Desulfobacteraceae bacterium]
MNLLFIPKVFPRASVIGGPILIHHRIKNLSKMGYHVTVLAPASSDKDHSDKSLEPYCENIILVDSPKGRTPGEIKKLEDELKRPPFFLSGDGGYDPQFEKKFRSLLARFHYDGIIAEYSMMGQYLEGAKEIIPAEIMTIISVHECYTQAFRQRASKGEPISEKTIEELFEYEFRMYHSVDRVLSLTQEDRQTLISLVPDLKEKISVVPHGVDTSFYIPDPEKSWNTKNLLYLGNFRHRPNVDAVQNFINYCWEKISREVPNATFYAIGFDPPPELLALRSNRIVVREGGAHSDVREIYWKSDIFVAPIELGGGFRGKILEALACGLPIVSTRLAAFGIAPINGKEMFVTDDYGQFTEHVIRLLEDTTLRKTVGANARSLGERFDHKNAAMKLNEVIQEYRTKTIGGGNELGS